MRVILRAALIAALAIGGTSVGAEGQWRRGRNRSRPPPPTFGDLAQDRAFSFCRLAYTQVRREWLGTGWTTDYPDSDRNLMLRLSQLTTTPVRETPQGEPDHIVISLLDDELFQCPFLFMSDAGTIGLSSDEVERLRLYLDKGGFLWADDFWGDYAWDNWAREIGIVLPAEEFPILDMPRSHLLFNALYDVKDVPQIPSIQFWYRSGRTGTSERGAESAVPHLRGIFNESGNLIVLMSHNTDIADGWEREGDDDEFFYNFSPRSYALGINVVLYVMTH